MFKKICIGVCCIMMSFMFFAGCKPKQEFAYDRVTVVIKNTYWQKFEAQEFSTSDFKWENIKEIVYNEWSSKINMRWMTVYLKEEGKDQILAAVDHFKTLDFVESAEVSAYLYIE